MPPEEIAEAIERQIIATTDKFGSQIVEFQSRVYGKLLTTVRTLDLDNDGYILQNANNRRILAAAEEILDTFLPGDQLASIISNTLSIIPKLDNLNSDYFTSISESFTPNRNFIKSLQAQTIKSIESNLLQDGLTAQVKTPIIDILNRNINSGGKFSGFVDEIKAFVEGDSQIEGRILRYSKTYLRDALFQYSRTYQESVTRDLDLEFYLYAGGLIDSSRPFCIERAGNYYHQKEIESWASLKWAGKNPITTESSIFTLAGGYSCAHSIMPVSIIIVPDDVIQRNIDNGNYKK
jgi:hypothetical protein